MATKPSKIAVVGQWPTPGNVKELRGFLDLIDYYRKFIKHYGIISLPLYDMLKKGASFVWISTSQTVFEQLKLALVQARVLAIQNFTHQFVVED